MRLVTNIHHASGPDRKCFQGRRSKVKVIARPSALVWWRRYLDGVSLVLFIVKCPWNFVTVLLKNNEVAYCISQTRDLTSSAIGSLAKKID